MLGRRRSRGEVPEIGQVSAAIGHPWRSFSYVEKLRLVRMRSDAVGKEQNIPLKPGHFLWRVLCSLCWRDSYQVSIWLISCADLERDGYRRMDLLGF